MKLGIFHFELLYNVLQEMHFLYDEEQMADTVLSKVSQALNAEAGTIFRVEKDGTLYPLASYGVSKESLRKLTFKAGVGVVGWVAQYMQPVKVDKPASDPRFFGAIDMSSGFQTRSIVASPIIVRNEMIGIIEFLNRRDGPFALQDMELISMIGRQVGIAMLNARVMKERDNNLAFQEAVMGSLSAGLIVADSNGTVMRFNPRAAQILGLADDAKGRPAAQVMGECNVLGTALSGESSGTGQSRQETICRIAGRETKIGYSVVPVMSKSGGRLGTALLFQDITGIQK